MSQTSQTNDVSADKVETIASFNSKAVSQLKRVAQFFTRHPTLALSVTYLAMSCFGLVYINKLFGNFDVNIQPHLEVTDFMLAAFHHPLSIAITTAFFALVYITDALDRQTAKVDWYARFKEKANKPFLKIPPLLFYSLFALIMINAGIDVSAEREARMYREQTVQSYSLQLESGFDAGAGVTDTFSGIQVLSDTVRFLWIRDPATDQVYAIPQFHVNALTPMLENSSDAQTPVTQSETTNSSEPE